MRGTPLSSAPQNVTCHLRNPSHRSCVTSPRSKARRQGRGGVGFVSVTSSAAEASLGVGSGPPDLGGTGLLHPHPCSYCGPISVWHKGPPGSVPTPLCPSAWNQSTPCWISCFRGLMASSAARGSGSRVFGQRRCPGRKRQLVNRRGSKLTSHGA